jgi:hypothetical protein
MGNLSQKANYNELNRVASISEVAHAPTVRKIKVYGLTDEHALENLRLRCKELGLPNIEHVPGSLHTYYCGTLPSQSHLFNPVLFGSCNSEDKFDGRYRFAVLYY